MGSRITRLLAGTPDLTLLIAGRDAAAVGLFVEYLLEEGIDAVAVPSAGAAGDVVAAARATMVIDASGSTTPDHATARACIAAGVPYIDISDDRQTVLAIRALDAQAQAAGVALISGAGVVPCLSMAAVASLAEKPRDIRAARIVLRRGNREQYGPASIASLLARAGRPMRWRQGGAECEVYCFQTGAQREGDRHGNYELLAYDVPDLDLLLEQWPDLAEATVWAGIELPFLARGLQILARWRRARGRAGQPGRTGLFETLARSFAHFGTARSSLRVRLDAHVGGQDLMLSWTLVAENGAGAWLHAAPAVAVARQMLHGTLPPGARVARLELAEIMVELKGYDIQVHKTDINR